MTDDVDARLIGARLRLIRKEQRKSLQAVALGLGVSYQQVRKYETGQNRISASMLYRAACVLKVDVGLFFENSKRGRQSASDALQPFDDALKQALNRITDPEIREHLGDLVRLLDRQK